MKGPESGETTACVLSRKKLRDSFQGCCGSGIHLLCVSWSVQEARSPQLPSEHAGCEPANPKQKALLHPEFLGGAGLPLLKLKVRRRAECSSSAYGHTQYPTVNSRLIPALPTAQMLPHWLRRTVCPLFLQSPGQHKDRCSSTSAWDTAALTCLKTGQVQGRASSLQSAKP